MAQNNSSMTYFNVSTLGLLGKCQLAISGALTSAEVKGMRIHVKMLSGDFLTFKKRSQQTDKISPMCRRWGREEEDIKHILTSHLSEKRKGIIHEISQICTQSVSNIDFNLIQSNQKDFAQFLLDPGSLNLHQRISMSDPRLPILFKKCRDYCFLADKERNYALLNQC